MLTWGFSPSNLSLPSPLEIMPLSSGLVAEALEGLQAACQSPGKSLVSCHSYVSEPSMEAYIGLPSLLKLDCAHLSTLTTWQS